ncbi:MAG: C10 family peptidase [Prevotella sp.]|nr:C10 family peptidase [Prevotella sp.]
MRRTFLFVTCFFVSILMMAGNVTYEQAEQAARKFLREHRSVSSSQQMKMAAKRQVPMGLAHDANAYYVFNVGSDEGFVVVSGSNLTSQVLGYATKGSFKQEKIPVNMKAWLDDYAEQIAYIERTMGKNQAPILRRNRAALAPLLTSKWNQDAPYNNMCPLYGGYRSVTGCVATALAQVINYHKYPAQTTAPIPSYTTKTYGISMPEIPITTIDWDNMLDSYGSGATTAQKNAVAQLMLLCGQAVEMNYTPDESGAVGRLDVKALRQYFGYDETVRDLARNAFSASEWEAIIYNEIANNRPVLYNGSSSGSGHAFVVDGYDGNELFHINWGWGGMDDGYFLLSVLNPHNNESIGSSSSKDGYSINQDAVVGIQHGTGEKIAERFLVFEMTNQGDATYTRSSSSSNFTGISVQPGIFNLTSETHQFNLGVALFNADDDPIKLLKQINWGEEQDGSGGWYPFSNISFGADLSDGDYYIVPVSRTENSDAWEPCWGSNVYRIKATISGNTLTLTEPTVDLSATVSTTGSTIVNTTVHVQAQITNNGTDFNDYVYLSVGNNIVGGCMFEAKAGETATFEIDFVPTSTGAKTLTLSYLKDAHFTTKEYVPFATGSVTIAAGEGDSDLKGTITITNANDEGNVEGTTAKLRVNVRNAGSGKFDNGYIAIDLYKYESGWSYQTYKGLFTTIGAGGSTVITGSFDNLELGGLYAFQLSYTLDEGNTWTDLSDSFVSFEVVDPSAERPKLSGSFTLTNANSQGNITETTAKLKVIVKNEGTSALEHKAVIVELSKYNPTTKAYEYQDDGGYYMDIAVGQTGNFNKDFTGLEMGARYKVQIGYSINGVTWSYITNSAFEFSVVEPAEEEVILTADNKTRKYGEENPELTYTKTGEGTLSGTPTLSCSATKTSVVGEYDIVIARGTVTNTNLTLQNGKLTVTKAPLKITAKDYTIKQGEALPTFEATYEGFKNNETSEVLTKQPVITTTATSASKPGEYEITVSSAEAQNYEFSYVAGKLTITEADLVTVTAKDYTIKYGDDIPAFEFTSSGATLEGTPSITCEATSASPVGTYPIVISKGGVTNYNVTYVNGTLTIEKAPLKITAKDYTIKQGEALPTFEANYDGFKNNETATVLTKKPVFSTTVTSASEPGEYEITVSGAEAQNYEFSYVAGKLTITEASGIIGVSVDNPMDIYDLQGNKVRYRATSLEGLPKGVYIINGHKVIVK